MTIDRETAQILLELLNPLQGSLDRQINLNGPPNAPDDREYGVYVTVQQERDLTQAVCILQNRLAS